MSLIAIPQPHDAKIRDPVIALVECIVEIDALQDIVVGNGKAASRQREDLPVVQVHLCYGNVAVIKSKMREEFLQRPDAGVQSQRVVNGEFDDFPFLTAEELDLCFLSERNRQFQSREKFGESFRILNIETEVECRMERIETSEHSSIFRRDPHDHPIAGGVDVEEVAVDDHCAM